MENLTRKMKPLIVRVVVISVRYSFGLIDSFDAC